MNTFQYILSIEDTVTYEYEGSVAVHDCLCLCMCVHVVRNCLHTNVIRAWVYLVDSLRGCANAF